MNEYVVLRAFGGPADGEMMPVKDGGPVFLLLPIPDDLLTDETTAGDLPRVRYDVTRIGWRDDDIGVMVRCLVAEGTPQSHVTDPLNALGGLARLVAGCRS